MHQFLTVLGVILALVGTCLIYNYSVTTAQLTPYLNKQLIDEIKAANAKRIRMQRIGLGLSLAGIILSAASTFF